MDEKARQTLRAYLEDVVAAERNFEDILTTFSKAGEQLEVQQAFATMAKKARTQHERVAARLEAIGGSPSTGKSLLAHALGFAPSLAQIGHKPAEINTQHLMMCSAAAAAEMAMYESLAIAAREAGDAETEQLARQLQQEEREDYDIAWALLPESAARAFRSTLK